MYHNSGTSLVLQLLLSSNMCITDPGDLSDREGYDFEQLRSIAKVQVRNPCPSICPFAALIAFCPAWSLQFATVLHAAGYDIADVE